MASGLRGVAVQKNYTMPHRRPRIVMVFLLVAFGCGSEDDKGNVPAPDANVPAPDACAAGTSTLAVVGPSSYVCHDKFRATFTVTNNSCQTLTIGKLAISAVVTGSMGGVCTPPGLSEYDPVVTSIAPGKTVVVQDITGGSYCCFGTVCPATFTCDQTYTYTVQTSAGELQQVMPGTHIDLGGCDTICAQ